jgi:thiopeptide-type bacteriocin biosynthesis protein
MTRHIDGKESLLVMLESGQTSSAVRLLLESLRTHNFEQWCLNHHLSYQEVASLRSAFVSAGTERILKMRSFSRWIQINIALKEEQWIQLMVGDFQDRIQLWLVADSSRACFFVNKAPGIRLRIVASKTTDIEEITRLLDKMAADHSILSWTDGAYEPEAFQFGGELGLALAHEYFCVESMAVMAFHRIFAAGKNSIRPEQFSVLLIDALLRSAVEDEAEIWDVWCKMELTGRLDRAAIQKYSATPQNSGVLTQRRSRGQLRAIHFGERSVSEPEHTLIESYRPQASLIGRKLHDLGQTGQLLWNTRHILPFWIIFHWNRMRFSFQAQKRMATYMVRLYSPKISS